MTERDVESTADGESRPWGPFWTREEYEWLAHRANEGYWIDYADVDPYDINEAHEGESDDLRRELLLACRFCEPTDDILRIILVALTADLPPVLRVLAHLWRGGFLVCYGVRADKKQVEDSPT